MKKVFSIALAAMALTMISCSDEQEEFEKNNDKIAVELLSSPNVTRSASTNNAENSEVPATYRVSYKGNSSNVQLLPSFAKTLQSASPSLTWQSKTLYGYTAMEPNPNGYKGGANYTRLITKKEATSLGIKNGYYICKEVFFTNTFELPSEMYFCMKGSVTPGRMGWDPENSGGYGFTLSQTGNKIVCKTRGYFIICDAAGAQYNMSAPARKLEFTFHYTKITPPNF